MSNRTGTDGVEFDVTESGQKMGFVEDAGVKTILPEATAARETAVDELGIVSAEGLHETGDLVFLMREGDQVEVVRHEAVGEDVDLV